MSSTFLNYKAFNLGLLSIGIFIATIFCGILISYSNIHTEYFILNVVSTILAFVGFMAIIVVSGRGICKSLNLIKQDKSKGLISLLLNIIVPAYMLISLIIKVW